MPSGNNRKPLLLLQLLKASLTFYCRALNIVMEGLGCQPSICPVSLFLLTLTFSKFLSRSRPNNFTISLLFFFLIPPSICILHRRAWKCVILICCLLWVPRSCAELGVVDVCEAKSESDIFFFCCLITVCAIQVEPIRRSWIEMTPVTSGCSFSECVYLLVFEIVFLVFSRVSCHMSSRSGLLLEL